MSRLMGGRRCAIALGVLLQPGATVDKLFGTAG